MSQQANQPNQTNQMESTHSNQLYPDHIHSLVHDLDLYAKHAVRERYIGNHTYLHYKRLDFATPTQMDSVYVGTLHLYFQKILRAGFPTATAVDCSIHMFTNFEWTFHCDPDLDPQIVSILKECVRDCMDIVECTYNEQRRADHVRAWTEEIREELVERVYEPMRVLRMLHEYGEDVWSD
jgi:hypothetical protein